MKILQMTFGALLVGGLLAGCGGGGGGSASTPPVKTAPAGIATRGAITGFGSVIVNSVHYDVSGAQITVNGQSATQSTLRVGEVVKIQGTADLSTGLGTASTVVYDHDVQGPIGMLNLTAGTFTVLGQNVHVDGNTSFDPRIVGGFSGLKLNDLVEVSGFLDAQNVLQATRVERDGVGNSLEASGVVSNLNAAGKKFNINALVIDYSKATLSNFTGTDPVLGDVVEVKGASVNASGELVASTVRRKAPEVMANGQETDVEGVISLFTSSTDFTVNGQRVQVTPSTTIVTEGPTNITLALNVRVEVEGVINAGGVLVANRIKIKLGSEAGLQAKIDSVNVAGKALVVLGVPVTITSLTRFEDRSTLNLERFSLADVSTGDTVMIRGSEVVANNASSIVASRLERRNATTEVRIRGVVAAADVQGLTLLGLLIKTDALTQYTLGEAGNITAAQFIAQAKGAAVEVHGTVLNGVITATVVRLNGGED